MPQVFYPNHWRQRSEEARTSSDEINDDEAKQGMLRIASGCEKIADRAEKRQAEAQPLH